MRKSCSTALRISRFLFVGLLLCWPAWGWSQSITATLPVPGNAVAINRVTDKIYVASSGRVTVVDGTSHATTTVVMPLSELAGYESVVVNEATNKIYVASSGVSGEGVRILGSLVVIDGTTNSITTVIALHGQATKAFSLAVNPSTNKIYLCNPNNESGVSVIDGATNATTNVTDPNALDLEAVAVAVNPVTNKIYVANFDGRGSGSGSVTVIDGSTNTTTTITDPNAVGPVNIAVNPVTNKIYVANAGNYPGGANKGNVTVIDGATNATTTVSDPNAIAPGGELFQGWGFGFGVAVNSIMNKIYVTNQGSQNVTVIDGATNTTSTVRDANAVNPVAVAVNEDTNTVYVANVGCFHCNPGDNLNPGSVTVINGKTDSVTTIIDPQAGNPEAVAVDPVTNQVYVENADGGGLSGGALTIVAGSGPASVHTLEVFVAGGGSGVVASSPLGIECGASCTASFTLGTVVSLNASADSGSAFSGWSGACTGTNPCDLAMNTDQFVTATFTAMQVAVPNVIGQTQTAATAMITGAGLVLGTATQQSSSTVSSGGVISESPAAGTDVAPGSAVNLVVSTGASADSVGGGSGYGGGGGIEWLTLTALAAALLSGWRSPAKAR